MRVISPTIPIRGQFIGSIAVKSGNTFVRVFIGQQRSGFFAAVLIGGSVWFETASTGIAALLSLTSRLQNA